MSKEPIETDRAQLEFWEILEKYEIQKQKGTLPLPRIAYTFRYVNPNVAKQLPFLENKP